ncbi:MAG TPA: crosslink repair DNA glycosylase YcaQ family protein [Acidimicrobiia bacterium]|nr:crosslink repair DNA glycosylase YcaQ family protein [Acidimicrobiia bacterium]
MARERLTLAQARRVALAAQGFTDPRPTGRVDRRHLRRVLDRIGLIQIDSVNVLVRSQELPLFARLGPHPRSLIDDATRAGELFEYWVHEASHVPTDHHHLYRWAMDSPRRWGGFHRFKSERGDFIEEIHEVVRERGPLVAGDLSRRIGPKKSWWDYDDAKVALEILFDHGRVAAVRRANDFARIYDLAERVIPADVLARPAIPEHAAKKELLVLAAKYHGVGTAADLADYHRIRHARPLFAELVAEERLIPVTVEGWSQPAYLHPDAVIPRRVTARALLSPFDPVVWYRDRTERLFDFHYRIEIYTPKSKRRYGYYVLPFLLGDRLVARVDLKADRKAGRLLVQAAWAEPGVPELEVAGELAEELSSMAAWLALDGGVELAGAGDLTPALRRVGVPTAASG